MWCWIPFSPYSLKTNHNFRERNRRPNGMPRCCASKRQNRAQSIKSSLFLIHAMHRLTLIFRLISSSQIPHSTAAHPTRQLSIELSSD